MEAGIFSTLRIRALDFCHKKQLSFGFFFFFFFFDFLIFVCSLQVAKKMRNSFFVIGCDSLGFFVTR